MILYDCTLGRNAVEKISPRRHLHFPGALNGISCRPGNDPGYAVIAAASDDGDNYVVELWPQPKDPVVRRLPGSAGGRAASQRDVYFDKEGPYLVSVGWDREVKVFQQSLITGMYQLYRTLHTAVTETQAISSSYNCTAEVLEIYVCGRGIDKLVCPAPVSEIN